LSLFCRGHSRAVLAYVILLAGAVLTHIFTSSFTLYLLPVYMLTAPFVLGSRISVSFSLRHIGLGLLVSLVILGPACLILSLGRTYQFIGPAAAFSQLIMVAVPEEVFFRGFLQETFGNDLKGVLVVSLLFGVAHLPAYFFGNDVYALLTFFPSLVMGYLYMKTSNVLPSVLFHLLSNVVYQGFMI